MKNLAPAPAPTKEVRKSNWSFVHFLSLFFQAIQTKKLSRGARMKKAAGGKLAASGAGKAMTRYFLFNAFVSFDSPVDFYIQGVWLMRKLWVC